MKLVFVLLLTALITSKTHALPTPKAILSRRDANSSLLELVTQYLGSKQKIEQANNIKAHAEAQASLKEAAIKSMIGFANLQVATNSTIAVSTNTGSLNTNPTSASSSLSAPVPAPTPSSTAYPGTTEPYTIIVPTGPAVVYAFRGTTKTVSLNPTTTTSIKTALSATTSAPPSSISVTLTTPMNSVPTASPTLGSTTPTSLVASPPTPASAPTGAQPVTVLNPTGPTIILASQGGTRTMTLSTTL